VTDQSVRKSKRADELVVGDRIAGEQLPLYSDGPAEVVFVRVHDYVGPDRWVFVAFALDDGFHDSTSFRPEAEIQIEQLADPTGMGYSRETEPDDNRPVSPGRVPLHTGAMVDGNQLVDETDGDEAPPCYVPNGFQAPEVIAERQRYCAASHPGTPCRSAAE
jgi:hypothetical protein